MKIFSASQIKKWDAFTIASEPITSIDLMERAASKCTEWILKQNYYQKHFYIFCGKGNNGGDGLAIHHGGFGQDIVISVVGEQLHLP